MELLQNSLEEQLYLGHINGPCAYLFDRNSSLLFIDGCEIGSLYRLFLDAGYRRHGLYLYRPDCTACRECHVLRIPTDYFAPSRSQRRVWKKGQAFFTHCFVLPSFDKERLELYQLYLKSQHRLDETKGASEELPSEAQYREFFIDTFLGKDTLELQLFAGRRLAGIGILDRVGNALSAVYFMFHPEFRSYSPGTYAILLGIEQACQWGLRYYYPGYYIKGCASMSYKANYYPHEIKSVGESFFSRAESNTM